MDPASYGDASHIPGYAVGVFAVPAEVVYQRRVLGAALWRLARLGTLVRGAHATDSLREQVAGSVAPDFGFDTVVSTCQLRPRCSSFGSSFSYFVRTDDGPGDGAPSQDV